MNVTAFRDRRQQYIQNINVFKKNQIEEERVKKKTSKMVINLQIWYLSIQKSYMHGWINNVILFWKWDTIYHKWLKMSAFECVFGESFYHWIKRLVKIQKLYSLYSFTQTSTHACTHARHGLTHERALRYLSQWFIGIDWCHLNNIHISIRAWNSIHKKYVQSFLSRQ